MFADRFWMLPSASGDRLWDPLPLLFWEVLCHPTPALSLCCLTHVYSLRVLCWFWLLAPPLSPGQFPDSPPAPTIGVRLQFAVYVLQFCWGGFSLPRGCTGLCFQGVGREVMHGSWCSPVNLPNHSQAVLESVVAGRNGANFSQHSVVWGGFPQTKASECPRIWFLLMLCLQLDGRREVKKKKRPRKGWGWFFLGPEPLCCLCCVFYLLAAIKGWFVSLFIFFCT
jgi:hypothetical protein